MTGIVIGSDQTRGGKFLFTTNCTGMGNYVVKEGLDINKKPIGYYGQQDDGGWFALDSEFRDISVHKTAKEADDAVINHWLKNA